MNRQPDLGATVGIGLWAMLVFFVVAVFLWSGCGGDDDQPYIDPDALVCCRCISPECIGDAGSDDGAVDAMPSNLPDGSPCDLQAEECAPGLTCRLYGGQGEGICHAAGPSVVGDTCEALGDPACGEQMDCFAVDSFGVEQECRIICSTDNPTDRCGAFECVPLSGQTFGYCRR